MQCDREGFPVGPAPGLTGWLEPERLLPLSSKWVGVECDQQHVTKPPGSPLLVSEARQPLGVKPQPGPVSKGCHLPPESSAFFFSSKQPLPPEIFRVLSF